MQKWFQKLASQNLGRPARSFIFFILFYLYLWLEVDLCLIHHGGGEITNFPAFFRGWAFFQEFTRYPGGLVEYLSAFLSQFFYYSWAGALVVTLQAWLICVCTDYFLKTINASLLRPLRFIPPILLLITYTQYTYNFVTTMALLLALSFVCVYLRVITKSKLLSLTVFLALSVIFYYIAGGAYLLFVVLCTIYELLFSHKWQMGLLYLLSAVVIPYVEGVFIFGVSIIDAFSNLLPFSWKILRYEERRIMVITACIIYLLTPFVGLLLGLWRMIISRFVPSPNRPNESDANSNGVHKRTEEKPCARVLSLYTSSPALRWFVESLVLLLIAGAAVSFSHDNKRKTLFEVDYYACYKMWPQVLKSARRFPNNYLIGHAVNRALYHTGRLAFDMCSYPQNPDTLFLTSKKYKLLRWKRFDICIDLGSLNTAEGDLVESLEKFGEHPIILKRLALINIVKGNLGAARIYLSLLSKTLFHSDWANMYLDKLVSDPNLSMDDYIQHLRRLIPEKDNEKLLSALLKKSTQEQIAFEYLMAWYLLTKQLDKFIQNLHQIKNFGYPEIPQHYQEAILLYSLEKRKAVDLYGYRLSPELYQQSQRFARVLKRHRKDEQVAFKKLAKDYGDSYLFYYTYRVPGISK